MRLFSADAFFDYFTPLIFFAAFFFDYCHAAAADFLFADAALFR